MSLYSDALAGTLDKTSLEAYLNTSNSIDAPSVQDDDTEGYTALTLAALEGHVQVVQLLLGHGANANAVSSDHSTPLWAVTARPPKSKERAKIVQLLLNCEFKADAKYSHPDLDNGSTPLENELRQLRDRTVIRLLVEAGGVTPAAKRVADELDITPAILPPSDINKLRTAIVGNIVAFIQFVFGWANALGNVVNSLLNRFGLPGWLTGGRVEIIKKEISAPKTKKEFKASATNFIKKYKLEKFFPDSSSPFLETLVSKAMEVQNDPTSHLGKAGKTDELLKIALYQPVLYCDDSGSMKRKSAGEASVSRMEMQAQLVERISSICTRLVPEDHGVHLRFINTRLQAADNLQMDALATLLTQVEPDGATEIGTNLRQQILNPLLYQANEIKRPLFVSIITDGRPEGQRGTPEREDTLKREIMYCQDWLKRNKLPKRSVIFQISQVGTDEKAEKFLRDLGGDPSLGDILRVTAQNLNSEFNELRRNEERLESWLLETLLTPIIDSDVS